MPPLPSESGLTRLRRLWGWGYEDEVPPKKLRDRFLPFLEEVFPGAQPFPPPPKLSDYRLFEPRFSYPKKPRLPSASASPYERILHALGRSLYDLIRLRLNTVEEYPDYVVYPESEEEILELLGWAEAERVVIIPYGGGTSVTGGVEAHLPPQYQGVISLDLSRMNRILKIAEASLLAEVEAGIRGPDLDARLKEYGLTFRHFPQSYHFSTLGGWIATRSAGHYSTREGKIEARVRGLTVITPRYELLKFPPNPGSSMGPEAFSLWIGCEGTLGVITRAWIELKPLPLYREVVGLTMPDFVAALEALRAIVQSGFSLSHLRALDEEETLVYRMLRSESVVPQGAYLIVGDESFQEPVHSRIETVLRICRRYGGRVEHREDRRDDPENWRSFFFAQPYLRDELVGRGYLVDTFETAVSFHQALDLYRAVKEATLKALYNHCGGGFLSCRTTHCYPTGVSLYFTFLAPSCPDAMSYALRQIKEEALSTLVSLGGTASHHHACGRDHRPFLERELPPGWLKLLSSIKSELDPAQIINPGVLLPSHPPPGG